MLFRSLGLSHAQQQPPVGVPVPPLGAGPWVFDTAEQHKVRVSVVTRGLSQPWAIAFLPDGGMLVTERPGRLRVVRDGVLDPHAISGVPEVRTDGNGGLMDVALHPNFSENGLVYLTYTKPVENGWGAPALAVGRLEAGALTEVRDLVVTEAYEGNSGLKGRVVFGRDGKLYMSKGNSKGLTQPGRLAPKQFRELWGVESPKNSPDLPTAERFTAANYRKSYHNPADDWGREGGVLRCDPMGGNLEIISRGFRNPWDMAMDDGFNFIGTDNDQNEGDKIFMPFYGAHFGWGHTWSYNWTDASHLPTAPHSGPFFHGSGTGVIHYSLNKFPEKYRNVFFINDWGRKCTYVMRNRWDGALLRSVTGDEPLEIFADANNSLYKPTDIEIGPDGALWVLGWGDEYGVKWNGDPKLETKPTKAVSSASGTGTTRRTGERNGAWPSAANQSTHGRPAS